jgi:phospholipid/cholesterol/gamma-HCH transport system substrate-binding protein
MADLTQSVASLVEQARPPLRRSVGSLGIFAGTFAAAEEQLKALLAGLPLKLERLGRATNYGGWVNFYLCAVTGSIPDVEGYSGDRGAANPDARCR